MYLHKRGQNRQRIVAGACVFILLFLSACSYLMETGNTSKVSSAMAQSSYAAADMLIQQSRSFITPAMPLAVGGLTDLDHPNEQTNFGRMAAEQIASRFVQLGYNVTDNMNTGAPVQHAPLAPPSSSPQDTRPPGGAANMMITGKYAVARDVILVNLRIIEAASGKVLASYDYNVPKTPDVRELVKTRADKDSFFNF